MPLLVLFFLGLLTSPTFAFDSAEEDLYFHHRYEMQAVEMRTTEPVFIQVQQHLLTFDGCNQFGLNGYFRKIEIPEGVTTVIQDVLADFNVMQTEIGCPRLEHPRSLDLRSPLMQVNPIDGYIHLHVLVPENMRLLVYRKKATPF